MRTARRNSWEQGIRINYVAPCWIKSAIRSAEYEKWLIENGIEFGEQADCAGCMIKIAADKSINGKLAPAQCGETCVQELTEGTSTGRSLMITPRSKVKEGFMDIDMEDYVDERDEYLIKKQATQLRIIQDQWRDAN
jgi:hypothetical protein